MEKKALPDECIFIYKGESGRYNIEIGYPTDFVLNTKTHIVYYYVNGSLCPYYGKNGKLCTYNTGEFVEIN